MKAFKELTEIELVELTEEQVQRYIDLACAEEGIRMLPPAPEPPTCSADTLDDLTVYMVGNFVFSNQDDAIAVLDAANLASSRGSLDYISGPSYRKRFVPRDGTEGGESVTPTRVLSAEKATRLADILAATEKAAASYKKDKELYDRISRERKNVVDGIREAIDEAQDRRWRRDALTRTYQRYLELADGNVTTASRFLVRTEGDVVAELLPEVAATAKAAGEVARVEQTPALAAVPCDGSPF